MSGWIGVDLDGTLAEYGTWQGPGHIGKPVPAMVERVKQWIAEGRDVRIFTARVAGAGRDLAGEYDPDEDYQPIFDWCKKHIGKELPVTCKKDFGMIDLWDDRCVQIVPNTGRRVDGLP